MESFELYLPNVQLFIGMRTILELFRTHLCLSRSHTVQLSYRIYSTSELLCVSNRVAVSPVVVVTLLCSTSFLIVHEPYASSLTVQSSHRIYSVSELLFAFRCIAVSLVIVVALLYSTSFLIVVTVS
ncbi:hypothetical protein PIB30_070148 [Stylosanthes scabra]|uniref:Uncharacterized protein n=1 Tax=Stylosanthes scabra TaxID=79078 RepID=A0ABU6ZM42_9FABA|nr:hypothetical protein [Stylosanthes scabra]